MSSCPHVLMSCATEHPGEAAQHFCALQICPSEIGHLKALEAAGWKHFKQEVKEAVKEVKEAANKIDIQTSSRLNSGLSSSCQSR